MLRTLQAAVIRHLPLAASSATDVNLRHTCWRVSPAVARRRRRLMFYLFICSASCKTFITGTICWQMEMRVTRNSRGVLRCIQVGITWPLVLISLSSHTHIRRTDLPSDFSSSSISDQIAKNGSSSNVAVNLWFIQITSTCENINSQT